ncbi:9479_t:CDS:1 [Cetraspora pellucida]|uniref:9479_t:CDS:1 n=1 Tax=Cetraspora pellucida TaxID=1433469 RepID=A0A9N8ZQ17_9GLOM|nr:9479_t:CDS:1 [Cetraspora pellucida]
MFQQPLKKKNPKGLENFKGDIFFYKQDRNDYFHISYQYATSSFRNIKDMNPKYILYPKADNEDDFDDIYTALNYAKDNKSKIAIRTGGHQYTGASSTDRNNIQLDLSNTYKKFEWNEDKTELEIGISYILDDFAKKLQDNGCFLPIGQCEYVGLGGHVQTGGYGQLARGFGLLADYIIAIRIISYDETEEKYIEKWIKKGDELFRAVIGGSPGNFGVITHVRLRVEHDEDYPNSYGLFAVCPYHPKTFKDFLDIMLTTVDEDDFDYCVSIISDTGIKDEEADNDDPSYDETYNQQSYTNRGNKNVIWPALIIIHAYQYSGYDEKSSPINKIKAVTKELNILNDGYTKISLLVRDWITLIRREFQLQYIKRGYFSDWEAEKLIETNWSDWATNRVNLAICQDLKVSAQYKYFGGKNSAFYKKGIEHQNDISISWRTMNFGVSFDVFFEKENFQLASEFQRENDKCISVTNPIFCDKDMRLLWATYDLNLDYFHDRYYDSEDKYTELCELRDKYDPDKIFIPNNFCVGVKREPSEEVLNDILEKNKNKFLDMLNPPENSDIDYSPIWDTWGRKRTNK